MSSVCSLLGPAVEDEDREYDITDYEGLESRWCPGCGDRSALTAMQKLAAAEQLVPDKTVFVSGIGCSSRFPHYMNTYGFHGIHGRALPVALGIRLTRPDLTVFVAMGDGDCTSIGAAHWLHTLRYNPDMTALLLDNNVYGLTKQQTSPTTPQGFGYRWNMPFHMRSSCKRRSFLACVKAWHPTCHLCTADSARSRRPGSA